MKNDTIDCTMYVTRVSSESELRDLIINIRPYELREGSIFVCGPSKKSGVRSAFVYSNGNFIRLTDVKLE